MCDFLVSDGVDTEEVWAQSPLQALLSTEMNKAYPDDAVMMRWMENDRPGDDRVIDYTALYMCANSKDKGWFTSVVKLTQSDTNECVCLEGYLFI